MILLHTNDFHGTLDAEKATKIRKLKPEGSLYCDSGDCIKTGNLGVPLRRELAWEMLALAGCDVGVPGNRESHVLRQAFEAKIAGHRHPLLCGNLFDRANKPILPRSLVVERNGLKIGLFGVMVAIVTERMATQSVSQMLWTDPIESATELAASLRSEVDVVIALTHIGHKNDLALADSAPGIDIILGGHSHTVLETPVRVGNTFVCQGGSHGKFLGLYEWNSDGLSGGLISL